MKKKNELKPCPFCGSEARFLWRSKTKQDVKKFFWDIFCLNEDCYLCEGADWNLTKKEIQAKWNSREKDIKRPVFSENIVLGEGCVKKEKCWDKSKKFRSNKRENDDIVNNLIDKVAEESNCLLNAMETYHNDMASIGFELDELRKRISKIEKKL